MINTVITIFSKVADLVVPNTLSFIWPGIRKKFVTKEEFDNISDHIKKDLVKIYDRVRTIIGSIVIIFLALVVGYFFVNSTATTITELEARQDSFEKTITANQASFEAEIKEIKANQTHFETELKEIKANQVLLGTELKEIKQILKSSMVQRKRGQKF